MLTLFEKAVLAIALIRLLSGSIEIAAAYLILRFNDVGKALIINSSLAFIGPLILIITTTIGMIGLAEKMSFGKFIWIFLGVALIIYGVKK
ncbi:YqhV family protein [Radiobacillus sp. PE A8.2]|uniref:YqhV family protein n=1 Tax=Radiobacillus sp. PE A8.2 TaxID=3380349 RepID=UPI003890DC72